MSEKDQANLMAILEACTKITKYTADFWDADALYHDQKSFDAVLMNFINIGEAISRISPMLKASNPSIEWQKIKDLRNIVAHDYFGVDAEEIWQIIQTDIKPLITDINTILKAL